MMERREEGRKAAGNQEIGFCCFCLPTSTGLKKAYGENKLSRLEMDTQWP